jgi:hypothetical protein
LAAVAVSAAAGDGLRKLFLFVLDPEAPRAPFYDVRSGFTEISFSIACTLRSMKICDEVNVPKGLEVAEV